MPKNPNLKSNKPNQPKIEKSPKELQQEEELRMSENQIKIEENIARLARLQNADRLEQEAKDKILEQKRNEVSDKIEKDKIYKESKRQAELNKRITLSSFAALKATGPNLHTDTAHKYLKKGLLGQAFDVAESKFQRLREATLGSVTTPKETYEHRIARDHSMVATYEARFKDIVRSYSQVFELMTGIEYKDGIEISDEALNDATKNQQRQADSQESNQDPKLVKELQKAQSPRALINKIKYAQEALYYINEPKNSSEEDGNNLSNSNKPSLMDQTGSKNFKTSSKQSAKMASHQLYKLLDVCENRLLKLVNYEKSQLVASISSSISAVATLPLQKKIISTEAFQKDVAKTFLLSQFKDKNVIVHNIKFNSITKSYLIEAYDKDDEKQNFSKNQNELSASELKVVQSISEYLKTNKTGTIEVDIDNKAIIYRKEENDQEFLKANTNLDSPNPFNPELNGNSQPKFKFVNDNFGIYGDCKLIKIEQTDSNFAFMINDGKTAELIKVVINTSNLSPIEIDEIKRNETLLNTKNYNINIKNGTLTYLYNAPNTELNIDPSIEPSIAIINESSRPAPKLKTPKTSETKLQNNINTLQSIFDDQLKNYDEFIFDNNVVFKDQETIEFEGIGYKDNKVVSRKLVKLNIDDISNYEDGLDWIGQIEEHLKIEGNIVIYKKGKIDKTTKPPKKEAKTESQIENNLNDYSNFISIDTLIDQLKIDHKDFEFTCFGHNKESIKGYSKINGLENKVEFKIVDSVANQIDNINQLRRYKLSDDDYFNNDITNRINLKDLEILNNELPNFIIIQNDYKSKLESIKQAKNILNQNQNLRIQFMISFEEIGEDVTFQLKYLNKEETLFGVETSNIATNEKKLHKSFRLNDLDPKLSLIVDTFIKNNIVLAKDQDKVIPLINDKIINEIVDL